MPSIFTSARSDKLEVLDQREGTPQEIAANFAEIARVNQYLGGTRAIRNALEILARYTPDGAQTRLELLDVATGSADIPRSVVRLARRRLIHGRFHVAVTATDLNPVILERARSLTPANEFPEITVERADALDLPYADRSFDIATCSMALHHFTPEQGARLMREMARVSRTGIIVNDLRRDRLAWLLITGLTRLLRADAITRHDAPLSVLRAYTIPEIRVMGEAAQLPLDIQVYAASLFRAVLIGTHRGPKPGSESSGIGQ